MDDLSERDLSGIADEDLSAEEREEIRRRMDTFLGRMQTRQHSQAGKGGAPKPKAKRLARWSPKSILRRG